MRKFSVAHLANDLILEEGKNNIEKYVHCMNKIPKAFNNIFMTFQSQNIKNKID